MDVHHSGQKYLYEQKIFLIMLVLNAALLILDTLQWLLNGKPGITMRAISLIIAVVYCAMTPVPCFFWSIYADYQVYGDEKRIKKLFLSMTIPLFINFIIAVLSAFYGLSFVIDQNNVYHRGVLFYLMSAICYFYLVHSIIFIIHKRKFIEKKVYIPLLLFALPPFIGGIIQSLFYGVSIVWACMALSIFIIFINIQNSQLYTDHLTGLYNRRQLDNYMQEWLRTCKENTMLGVIMADLDSFKKINDSWGHIAGDTALVEAGKILKGSFRKEDLICRYGGDEFIIVLKVQGMADLVDAVEQFKTNTKTFNECTAFPYSVNFSVGFDILDYKSGMTVQQFIRHIDNLMYNDKSQKKSSI
jgi:diguanylate cyclase (GGDEF)-like protein